MEYIHVYRIFELKNGIFKDYYSYCRLESIPLNKHSYQHDFNFIDKNNLNLNVIKKKIDKRIKEKRKNN
jgi:hypothetical protein